jgi:hypothetical protein
MTKFPIGFWNYTPIGDQDATSVGDWADAGMTLALSPNYGPEPDQILKMRSILDAAAEKGIRMILCDQRSRWQSLMQKDEATYRAEFRQAVADLGGHPAVLGFHVGDEPDAKNFPFACRASSIQKEIAPHLSPFCNLFPWYSGVATCVDYENWAAYLDEYVTRAKPDFLCYDCYTQLVPGDENMDMYFRNLREYSEAANRHNIPFWTTLLSVGHFRYRCPREDDFRWQINTAVAHGAKGLLWFFFYMQKLDNYRVSPIDEHGERTETFEWLSRTNRTFLKTQAAVIQDLDLQKVSHVGRAWGGYPLLDGRDLVIKAASKFGTDLIVSEFRHKNGDDYVAVVNNSQTESTQIDLWIRGRRPRLYRIGWQAQESPVTCGDGWNVEQGEDFVAIHPWLAPGQLELYRVEQDLNK